MTLMHYGEISTLSKPVSRLIQGTAFFTETETAEHHALLDGAFELGCTTFDTAHLYHGGASERILGQWIAERGIRNRVVIVSKGAHPIQGRENVSPTAITNDLHESLAHLRTDFIDVYLFHRDDPDVPVGPLVETMNAHIQAGIIGLYGASNWTVARIAAANRYAAEHGLVGMGVSSPQFSLAEAIKEPWPGCVSIGGAGRLADRQWYTGQQMPLFTWSSLGGGFLSGRFTPDNLDSFSSYYDTICVQAYCYPENFARLERAKELAAKKGLTLPQIGLAYVFSQPLELYTIIGSRTAEEFAANAAALEVRLSTEEVGWLEGD